MYALFFGLGHLNTPGERGVCGMGIHYCSHVIQDDLSWERPTGLGVSQELF